MRTKCSGGQPCNKCVKDVATCAFGDGKKERTRKLRKPPYPSTGMPTKLEEAIAGKQGAHPGVRG
jgi:hypothetical protein